MKVMILTNGDILLYKLRKELISKLINDGHEVIIPIPKGIYFDELKKLGANVFDVKIDGRGTSIKNDLKLLFNYNKIVKKYKPDLIITYTIKPNIYGGIISRINKIKYISNITGLGTSLENDGLLKTITTKLYKLGVKSSECVFFQNKKNLEKCNNLGIKGKEYKIVNGSGVNTDEYNYSELRNNKSIKFLTIARVMKDKGIEEWIEVVKK